MRLPWKSSKQNTDQRSFYPGHHTQKLCQAVANSCEMMQLQDADFVITHPEGYELNPEITKDSKITIRIKHLNADFIYTKNWRRLR
jgi:N-succinyl-L-ornithine transcarbamylase